MAALLLFTAIAGVTYMLVSLDLPADSYSQLGQTTYLYAADGKTQLAKLSSGADREVVSFDRVPDVLVDAVLASEDQHFFEHSGLDPAGILRATWHDIRNRDGLQGGSTITQQYVKNAYLTSERTIWRKLKEAAYAVKVERKFDKKEILERYLNTIYFGRGAYGVQAASRAYFAKNVEELDLPRAAYLAGLIRAPEFADARVHLDVAEARRAKVLANMVETGAITPAERREALVQPLVDIENDAEESIVIEKAARDSFVAQAENGTDYFIDYVRRELIKTQGEQVAFSGGLRVTTSLDFKAQKDAYRAVYGATLTRASDPAGALVAVDDQGRIRAMVGGRDWNMPPEECAQTHCKVNLAVGRDGGGSGRQPGSTFKPVLLAETVKEGYSVESSFPGPPKITLPKASNGADWNVANFDEASYGRVNLVDATRNSVNTVYAQLAVAIGANRMRDMARELGVKTPLKAHNSLVLGTGEVSVLDMAAAFSTFANRGVRIEPRAILKIETAGGAVIEDNEKPDRTRVLKDEDADVVNFCLRQVVERGSGTAALLPGRPQALIGKTGTTQAFGDAWFVGATRKLTTAVWMGFPEGNSRKMDNVRGEEVTGGSFPALIFKRFMVSPYTSGISKADPFPTPERFGGRILNSRIPYVTPASTVTTSSGKSGSSTTSKGSTASTTPASTVPSPTTTAVSGPTTTQAATPPPTRPPRTVPTGPG